MVVLGDDAADVERSIDWHGARRIRNPDPSRGLSSSLQHGIEALARRRGCRIDRPRRSAAPATPRDPRAARRRGSTRRDRSSSPSMAATPAATRSSSVGRRSGWSPTTTGDRGLGPLDRRKSGSRPGDPDPGRRRQSRCRHARGPDRIAGECLGRARPGERRAGRSLPRSPRRRRLLRAGHGPVPSGPPAHGRTSVGRPAPADRAGRDLDRHRRGRRSVCPADRAGPGAVRRPRHRARRVARDARCVAGPPDRAWRGRCRGHRESLATDRRVVTRPLSRRTSP